MRAFLLSQSKMPAQLVEATLDLCCAGPDFGESCHGRGLWRRSRGALASGAAHGGDGGASSTEGLGALAADAAVGPVVDALARLGERSAQAFA
jgi:hypothetical protein